MLANLQFISKTSIFVELNEKFTMQIIPIEHTGLPFLSEDAVLFLSNEEGSRIDEYIAQNYEYFKSMFKGWGYSLVYLPEVFARLSSEALNYCFPGIQDGDVSAKSVNDRIMAMLHIEPYTGFLFHGNDGLHFYCAENDRINLSVLQVVLQTHRVRRHRSVLSETKSVSESPEEAFNSHASVCARPSIGPGSLRLKRKMKGMAELFKVDVETEDDTFASMQTVPASVAEEEPDILDPKARAILDEIERIQVEFGISIEELETLLDSRIRLSRLTITPQNRIYLSDYGNREIRMDHLSKAVYFLYLRHPKGIRFKELSDYRDELLHIYLKITGRDSLEDIRKSIDDIVDPLNNAINVKVSRVKSAFRSAVSDRVARHYYIDGTGGMPKKVSLDRKLIIWQA